MCLVCWLLVCVTCMVNKVEANCRVIILILRWWPCWRVWHFDWSLLPWACLLYNKKLIVPSGSTQHSRSAIKQNDPQTDRHHDNNEYKDSYYTLKRHTTTLPSTSQKMVEQPNCKQWQFDRLFARGSTHIAGVDEMNNETWPLLPLQGALIDNTGIEFYQQHTFYVQRALK